MNRPIKFRGWDIERGRMLPPYDLWEGTLMAAGMARTYTVDTMPIPMQFTGLLDKNGKEIYEGDVVISKTLSGFRCEDKYEEAHANDNEDEENGETYYGSPKIVKFVDGAFSPREYYENCDDGYYSYRYFDLKIIGNIYENPELLEV